MLRPGGRLLISDYCRKAGTVSTEFSKYIQQRGYDLHSPEGYGQLLSGAGFLDVVADDRTWQVCTSQTCRIHILMVMACAHCNMFMRLPYVP